MLTQVLTNMLVYRMGKVSQELMQAYFVQLCAVILLPFIQLLMYHHKDLALCRALGARVTIQISYRVVTRALKALKSPCWSLTVDFVPAVLCLNIFCERSALYCPICLHCSMPYMYQCT